MTASHSSDAMNLNSPAPRHQGRPPHHPRKLHAPSPAGAGRVHVTYSAHLLHVQFLRASNQRLRGRRCVIPGEVVGHRQAVARQEAGQRGVQVHGPARDPAALGQPLSELRVAQQRRCAHAPASDEPPIRRSRCLAPSRPTKASRRRGTASRFRPRRGVLRRRST